MDRTTALALDGQAIPQNARPNMEAWQAQEKRRPKPKNETVRVGRPPREFAGEVDERILDAARQVFLERGLNGASIDEIARIARAGKPTIYARFPSKEALFMAVGMRNARAAVGRFEGDEPTGATLEEKLVSVGANILKRFLVADTIDYMRLSAAEARRFPDLAKFGQMARERGIQAVGQVLAQLAASDPIGAFPAFAPKRVAETTRCFIDLVVTRFLLRAMFGEDLAQLRAEIDDHVARSVPFFLAACRGVTVERSPGTDAQ